MKTNNTINCFKLILNPSGSNTTGLWIMFLHIRRLSIWLNIPESMMELRHQAIYFCG